MSSSTSPVAYNCAWEAPCFLGCVMVLLYTLSPETRTPVKYSTLNQETKNKLSSNHTMARYMYANVQYGDSYNRCCCTIDPASQRASLSRRVVIRAKSMIT